MFSKAWFYNKKEQKSYFHVVLVLKVAFDGSQYTPTQRRVQCPYLSLLMGLEYS